MSSLSVLHKLNISKHKSLTSDFVKGEFCSCRFAKFSPLLFGRFTVEAGMW